jgi:nucleotide-binding universal stress UspA family protein
MLTIKHILFPCDFSEQCSSAVPFVLAIASRFEARVTLLTVNPPPRAEPPAALEAEATLDARRLAIEPQSRLETILVEEFAGFPVQTVRNSGDPALKISEFAHDNKVDLIMMPTHGYGLFRSLLIGSVTAKVLHDAKCPVWTATHDEEQQPTNIPRTILCAVDGTPRSLGMLEWASAFSREMGATLKLIHVAPRISDALALPSEEALQEEVNRHGDFQMCLDAQGLLQGFDLGACLLAPSRSGGASGGTPGRQSGHYWAWLTAANNGATAYPCLWIVHKSPCPVLSV